MRSSHPALARVAGSIALTCMVAVALACPAAAGAGTESARLHPTGSASASASSAPAEAARVARYWTPARMRSAVPLDLELHGDGLRRLGAGAENPLASASFKPVPTPTTPPYSVNGRIFVRQGNLQGYCSGTAINTPSRQLVLTAAHCVNSGPRGRGRRAVWSQYLEFVPAYSAGSAPFGAFVAKRNQVFAAQAWINHGNPDFDLGAFVTHPNADGANVADAVGGGATIVLDQDRHQKFQTFGYPGESTRMQGCQSPYIGDDALTYTFAGPPTMGIRCHWLPGASGGGWLIADGTQVNGVSAYLHTDDTSHTYGPYFNGETVGKLTAGL
jgi:V8-like Glu-specific endopeptidase